MASIRPRTNKDGSISYRAEIRIKRAGKIVWRESGSFPRKKLAEVWAGRRELDLAEPGALDRAIAGRDEVSLTVSELIDKYVDVVFPLKPWGRSKTDTLKQIQNADFGLLSADLVRAADIIDHCKAWSERSSPQTALQHYVFIRGVFGVANELLRCEVDYSQVDIAQRTMSKLGIIAKGDGRDRRPTIEEMTAIVEEAHHRRMKQLRGNVVRTDLIPMDKVLVFTMFSGRRQAELGRMLRSQTDYDRQRVLITDMKHPTKKMGNDIWVSVPDEAWKVMLTMPVNPKYPDNWFPYFGRSLGDRFRQLIRDCGLYKSSDDDENLRFHDLRHECASWLFERNGYKGQSWDVPRVAAVTGHQSWDSLKRYTQIENIEPNDKWEGWVWAERVCCG
jgi:integrase